MASICKVHNLQQDTVCMGEMCHKRIGCQLCIRKHDHKFYLDSKQKQSKLSKIQKQLDQKLVHLKKYIKSNIESLKLEKYRETMEETFDDELLFVKTKIQEEKQNFQLWIDKTEKFINETILNVKQEVMKNWQTYSDKSIQYLKGEEEYEQLRSYFKDGNWSQHSHVEKGVNFLYSEEVLFKFNRNMDNLKKTIHNNRKENNFIFTWLYDLRLKHADYELCPVSTFQGLNKKYAQQPNINHSVPQSTHQTREDEESVTRMIMEDKKALLMYPKQIYEPFQHVYKVCRINNALFATTGARSLNIWSKIDLQPEKIYDMDFTSYGLSTFIERGEDESDVLLFGKSNGEIGELCLRKQKIRTVKAHDAAVRDVIQFDDYHFVTASQDWLVKVWAKSQAKDDPLFASHRGTLKGHSGKLHCISKFGPNLLAGGADGTVKLWDIQSESYDEVFEHEKQIYSLIEIRPQLFLCGGELDEARLFDYRTPKSPACKVKVEHCCNSALRYNENSFIFADRNVVKLIDIRKYSHPEVRYENSSTYTHAINSMEYLSDMEIGMGGSDCLVTIWKY